MKSVNTSPRKSLLLAYTREDVEQIIHLTKRLREQGHAFVILGADFYSWVELRRHGLEYRTPAEYLKREDCGRIDKTAAELARSWYGTISESVTFHGISLGEMMEYDFAHLFIDALRSIEIAKVVVDIEKPDEVLLPEPPLRKANAVRYESLSRAMSYVAKSSGLRTSNIGTHHGKLAEYALKAWLARQAKSGQLLASDILSSTDYTKLSKKRIVFIDYPKQIFELIKRQFDATEEIVVNLNSYTMLRRSKERMKTPEPDILRNLEPQESTSKLTYCGIPLTKIMRHRFLEFLKNLPRLAAYVDGTERFIQTVRPDIVAVMEDISPILRTITRVCRIHNVPTIVIQHGITGADIGGLHVMPVEADVQAVWGISSRQWGISRGKAPDTQIVTGNPAYDSFAGSHSSTPMRSGICEKLGLDHDRKVILIATSWYQPVASCYTPEEDFKFIVKAFDAMRNFSSENVVVKLHPAYSAEYKDITKSIAHELNIDGVIITEKFLWELLNVCDVLITQTSTVALEALLLNKPVIIIRTLGATNPYAECEGIMEVNMAEEELVSAIRDSLYNEGLRETLATKRKESIDDYVYNQDGKAAKRVANLIEMMIVTRGSQSVH